MSETSSPNLRRLRLILWAAVIVAGIIATIIYFVAPPQQNIGVVGGNFDLQATTGAQFTQDDLKGTPSLVFFGYTYCPDVCPTTLSESTAWRSALGLTDDDLRIILFSVDPERDGVDHLATYLSGFSGSVTGVTGDIVEVEKAKKAFGVYSEKVQDESSTEYLVNHTASVFMLNADGGFEGTISYGEDTATAIEKVKKLTGRS